MKVARVYLDTCVWCRPFDEVRDGRVLDEAMALVRIVRKAERDQKQCWAQMFCSLKSR